MSSTYIDDGLFYCPPTIVKNKTRCKHGEGTCELCGTCDATDEVHTTTDGVGPVAALTATKKRKRQK